MVLGSPMLKTLGERRRIYFADLNPSCIQYIKISVSVVIPFNEWSTMIYLSFKFSFTVGGEGAARLWGVGDGAGAATADGLMEGVKEKAEGADGVSEGGLEAKEKLDVPEPNGVGPPREKADAPAVEFVVGTEKVKDDDDDDTGAEGAMLNGAADE